MEKFGTTISEKSELGYDSFNNYRRRYRNGWKSNNTWGGRLERIAKAVSDKLAFM
jgi:hypothetical protein